MWRESKGQEKTKQNNGASEQTTTQAAEALQAEDFYSDSREDKKTTEGVFIFVSRAPQHFSY